MKEKIKEMLNNEEICAEILMCDTAEKVAEVLKKHNIEISLDEIAKIKEDGYVTIEKYKNSGDELNLELLDDVVGGSKFWRGVGAVTVGAVGGFGLGVVCGVCPAFTPAATKIAIGYAGVAAVYVNQG